MIFSLCLCLCLSLALSLIYDLRGYICFRIIDVFYFFRHEIMTVLTTKQIRKPIYDRIRTKEKGRSKQVSSFFSNYDSSMKQKRTVKITIKIYFSNSKIVSISFLSHSFDIKKIEIYSTICLFNFYLQ